VVAGNFSPPCEGERIPSTPFPCWSKASPGKSSQLPEKGTINFPKREFITSLIGKFLEPELASFKENINKIYKKQLSKC
jgi:hypothetical protein